MVIGMGKWLALFGLGLIACSSSGADDGGASHSSGGTAGANGGGTSAGSANTNGAGTNAGGSAATGGNAGESSATGGSAVGGANQMLVSSVVSDPAKMRGWIYLTQYTADKSAFSYDVEVGFDVERGQWDGCTRNQLGTCWYYDCPPGSNALGNTDPPTSYQTGGTVTITGSRMVPMTVPQETSVMSYQLSGTGQLWPLAGGTVTVEVTGANSVPAFSMQVPVASHVFLTSLNGRTAPVSGASIRRADGLKLEWLSAGAGQLFFAVFKYMGARPAAICNFDGSASSGELPASILEQLDPGDYYYQLRGDVRSHMVAGVWDIETSSYAFGTAQGSSEFALTLE